MILWFSPKLNAAKEGSKKRGKPESIRKFTTVNERLQIDTHTPAGKEIRKRRDGAVRMGSHN